MIETLRLKLNVSLRGNPEGAILNLRSRDGVPLDTYWRRRVEDSAVDSCVEVVKAETPKKPKVKANDKES